MNPRFFVPAVLLLVLACGDDAVVGSSASSPVVLDDPSVMVEGRLPANLCELIPAAENVDLLCNDSNFCGNGGLCVEPIGSVQGQCSQACFPEPPSGVAYPEGWDATFSGCGNSCAGSQICATLLDDAGAPILLDLDLDGAPDVVGGACQSGAVGDQRAYDPCGSAGVCGADLACLTLPNRDTGTCFPTCESACDAFESYSARCSFTTADTKVCLIACEPTNPASCPQGTSCAETAQGAFTCVR